jgi:hypothetical protein
MKLIQALLWLGIVTMLWGGTAHAETWSCEDYIGGKTFPHEWTISGDLMRPKGADRDWHVLQNDDQVAVGAVTSRDTKGGRVLLYVIIDKKSGREIELNWDDELVTALGKPNVMLGHCTLAKP